MPKTPMTFCTRTATVLCGVCLAPFGRDYPWSFLRPRFWMNMRSGLRKMRLLISCLTVRRNLARLSQGGAPRAYVDLNRASDELDPALIEGVRRRGIIRALPQGLG